MVNDWQQVLLLFHSREFSCSLENFTISRSDPQWYNYALCGVRGVIEHMGAGSVVGFNALVDGSVPKSAGLSSSSALVCCAALATAQVNGWTLTKVTNTCLMRNFMILNDFHLVILPTSPLATLFDRTKIFSQSYELYILFILPPLPFSQQMKVGKIISWDCIIIYQNTVHTCVNLVTENGSIAQPIMLSDITGWIIFSSNLIC